MPDSVGQTLIATAIVMALGAAWGIWLLGGSDDRPQCVPCSCASEPFTYPPEPFVNAPWPDPLPSPAP